MSVGAGQLLLIALAVFILFGAGRLPKLMEDLAKGIKAFKKGMADETPASPTLAITDQKSDDEADTKHA